MKWLLFVDDKQIWPLGVILTVLGQLARLQVPKCTGLFYMHNSNKRNAEPLIRALNCHSTLYWQWCTIWRQSSWTQKLIYEKRGKNTVSHTAIMQLQTEDTMIERTVQYEWIILCTDDSTLKLPTWEQVSQKQPVRVDCHPESVDNK